MVPIELNEITDQVTFEKSRHYAIDKRIYSFFHETYNQIETYVNFYTWFSDIG